MCDYRTVAIGVTSWAQVGELIRASRTAAGLTQAALAKRVDLERSMVSKIEAGERGVDALELYRFAEALDVPLTHLVSQPAPAIVSRREQQYDDVDDAGRLRYRLDIALEKHARRVEWLLDGGWISRAGDRFTAAVANHEQARDAASDCRQALQLGEGPMPAIIDVAERLGLFLTVVPEGADGASMRVRDGCGAAVIGVNAEPGRRRMTAVHELAHHVLGDEYSSDVGVHASRDERESVVQAFAAEMLLPRAAVLAALDTSGAGAERSALIALAARYRVSWSVVLGAAAAVAPARIEVGSLRAQAPVDADFLRVVGTLPLPDLALGQTGPVYRRAVIRALDTGHVTAARASQMLYGLLATTDLQA